MRYKDGQQVKVGDKIVADNSEGVVVEVIGGGSGFENHSPWEHLVRGIVVETKDMGMVHYPEVDEDIRLVSRAEEETNGHRQAE